MATPEKREAVLADLAAGVTQRAAARTHGVPIGTVAYWCAQARQRGDLPSEAPPRLAPVQGGKNGRGKAGSRTASPAATPAKPPRATRPGQVSAADLPFDARQSLRDAVTKGLQFLSAGPAGDPKGWAQAARGLKEILTQTPDILTFDERTGTRELDGDEAEIAAAFGLDGDLGAPALHAISGGAKN